MNTDPLCMKLDLGWMRPTSRGGVAMREKLCESTLTVPSGWKKGSGRTSNEGTVHVKRQQPDIAVNMNIYEHAEPSDDDEYVLAPELRREWKLSLKGVYGDGAEDEESDISTSMSDW